MSRVCLIGDSHLAALKLGWNSLAPEFPHARLSFFAAPGKSLEGLAVRDGALVPTGNALLGSLKLTSGGETRIAGDYDVYVVHGLELSTGFALDVCRKYRAESQAKDWRTPVSDDCFVHAILGAARDCLAGQTMAKVRAISAAPILFCPVPMADARNQKIRQTLSAAGEAADVVALFGLACDTLARAIGGRFLPQPAETLEEDGIGTKASYSSSPARFHAELAKRNDNSHMNTDYGIAVLKRIMGALAHPDAALSH